MLTTDTSLGNSHRSGRGQEVLSHFTRQVYNMASTTIPTGPTNLDAPGEQTTSNDSPLQLAQFLSGLSPEQELNRTAAYIRNPPKYLEQVLGKDVFNERKNLLCLPEKFDKDIYGTGEHRDHFQQHIAKLFGREHGLFFVTGVQAQLAAVKIHCERAGNNRVAWHATSHLETAEEKAYDILYGLRRRLLGSSETANPTFEEIQEVLSLPEDQRPAVILLEIPNRELGCATYSFSELEKISSACRKAHVMLHCDGARIWEIEPYYQEHAGKTFADISNLFDTIYVSFYKGMRGATGAMLLCDDESFKADAEKWRRRAGGTAFTLFYEVIDCQRGFNENIGSFAAKWGKMQDIVQGILAATAKFKTANGDPVISFQIESPTCCQTRTVFQGYSREDLFAARDRVVGKMNVQVFHRLMPKKSLDEESTKSRPNGDAAKDSDTTPKQMNEEDHVHREMTEWMIVAPLMEVETKVFVDAYVALSEELVAGATS